MKVNIFEDSIDGEVQDGSINMHEELNVILRKLESQNFGDRTEIVGALFESEDINLGRLEFNYSSANKTIKWYLVGYYKDREYSYVNNNSFGEVAKFEFSKRVIANGYRYLVNKILKDFPEITSYKSILGEYRIKCNDFDVFSKNGLITGQEFIKDNPTYVANFTAEWPLDTYLEDIQEIAQSYVIPHDIRFEEDFRDTYYKTLKRLNKIAKAFQKGTFEGHKYYFSDMSPTISTTHNAYDKVNNIMKTKFTAALTYSFLHIDGESVRDKIIPSWERDTKGTNDESEYLDRLNDQLTRTFKKFNIRYT